MIDGGAEKGKRKKKGKLKERLRWQPWPMD
jgi:hypothetical protein